MSSLLPSVVSRGPRLAPGLNCLLAALLSVLATAAAGRADGPFALGGCQVRFATAQQAREHLLEADAFTRALSQFDLDSRTKQRGATRGDYRKMLAEQPRDWPADVRARYRPILQRVAERLRPWQLPLPRELWLIRTTGVEEANAAYCRRNAIVLPVKFDSAAEPRLEQLLLHELFHVLSNQNPALRKQLYALIGFIPCDPIALPADWAQRRITNPDGPEMNYRIRLKVDERPVDAVPVLVASVARFDPEQGGEFFRYLQFRLLAVEQVEGRWQPAVDAAGQLRWIETSNASFHAQIGENTKYIIHPDEVLADNFAFLALGRKDLKTPQLLARLDAVLQAAAASRPDKD